ncbi:putative membrane protein YphA (DoxX/SURF4 family) [Novosphingobium sp. PhB55]|uniref:DoxX family protein n=1 Tax=Novosphingobium sp. PhB55 TaxID=2485106 RepID=UPI0010665CBA|nr:DoxX family protein [Novosphingobium sp. PhB55]TDW67487.1 putative membrane protein YphA (DoxX/SURF4 family) [Novosphingobium sp. PhB55]
MSGLPSIDRTPSAERLAFVGAVLDFKPTAFLARLALVSAYLVGGVDKLGDWPAALAEQSHFGLTPPALWAGLTIAVELIGAFLVLGGRLVLQGRLVWLGAGMLGVFTFLAALVANAFWTMPEGPERFGAMNAFFEHMGLVGGFVLVAILARKGAGSA